MRKVMLLIAALALVIGGCAAQPQQQGFVMPDTEPGETFSIPRSEILKMEGVGKEHAGPETADHVGSVVERRNDKGYLTDTRGNDQLLFACDLTYNGNTANGHGEDIPYRTYDVFDRPGGDCTAIDTGVNLENHWICTGGGVCSGKSKHPG